MAKTALELTTEEWQSYHPGNRTIDEPAEERWALAWEVARAAARLLRERFQATRVVVFGSLVHKERFSLWSDIDIAAWGVSPERFYGAVAAVTGISTECEIQLVDPEECSPGLLHHIEHGGVEL